MLPHLREDLRRRRRRREFWDLTHEDTGALGRDGDPLAEAMDIEVATSTHAPSEVGSAAGQRETLQRVSVEQ